MYFPQASLSDLQKEYLNNRKTMYTYRQNRKKAYQYIKNTNIRYEIGIINQIIYSLHETINYLDKYIPDKNITELKKVKQNTYQELSIPDPQVKICDTITRDVLLQIIYKSLTKRQFEILYMYYYENFTLTEISSQLKISRTTVTEHLQKSLKKLKDSSSLRKLTKEIL